MKRCESIAGTGEGEDALDTHALKCLLKMTGVDARVRLVMIVWGGGRVRLYVFAYCCRRFNPFAFCLEILERWNFFVFVCESCGQHEHRIQEK